MLETPRQFQQTECTAILSVVQLST